MAPAWPPVIQATVQDVVQETLTHAVSAQDRMSWLEGLALSSAKWINVWLAAQAKLINAVTVPKELSSKTVSAKNASFLTVRIAAQKILIAAATVSYLTY